MAIPLEAVPFDSAGEKGKTGSERKVKPNFTPTYSSWLNQAEIWFARIERDVLARGVFTSVKDLARKIMRYIREYTKCERPFRWKMRMSPTASRYTNEFSATGTMLMVNAVALGTTAVSLVLAAQVVAPVISGRLGTEWLSKTDWTSAGFW